MPCINLSEYWTTLEKVSIKWDPQSREIEKFGKGTKGKRKSDRGTVKSSHLTCELLEVAVRIYLQSITCLCVCSKLHASKSTHLRCELFTLPQSDFRACFLFP